MLTQHLSGNLLRESCPATDEDVSRIAGLPNPPLVKLTKEDIIVRKCRLASDRIDSRHGRFRTEELERLLDMVQGAPVLIGHDKRTVGVARFFGGSVEERDGVNWIIPKFYWPRAHSKSEDLRVMIDSGVYNEASIAFVYNQPTCSVCGKDIRSCSHWPGREYNGERCFFYYDGVERVTEGSLVYRGAAPGTGIELALDEQNAGNPTAERTLRIKLHGRLYDAALTPARKA